MPAYATAALLLLGAAALIVELRGSPDDSQPAVSTPTARVPGVPAADVASAAPPAVSDPSIAAPEAQPTPRQARAGTPPAAPDGRAGIAAKLSVPTTVPAAKAAKVAAPASVAAAAPIATTPVTAPAPGPAPTHTPVVSQASSATRVVHRHRLGNCRGVLRVSPQGIEYVPEGDNPKDAFHFAYGQFVHSVDGDGLTVKTGDRTFRFEPLTVNGVRDGKDLAALGASLSAHR